MRPLVVFYSRSGTNKGLAETIARELGGDLDQIVDGTRRSGPLGFVRSGYAATTKRRTKIRHGKDPKEYEMVIIVGPIWAGKITPAMRTYLMDNDLSQKRVVLVFCCLSGDPASAMEELKEIVPNAEYNSTFCASTEDVKSGRSAGPLKEFIDGLRP